MVRSLATSIFPPWPLEDSIEVLVGMYEGTPVGLLNLQGRDEYGSFTFEGFHGNSRLSLTLESRERVRVRILPKTTKSPDSQTKTKQKKKKESGFSEASH